MRTVDDTSTLDSEYGQLGGSVVMYTEMAIPGQFVAVGSRDWGRVAPEQSTYTPHVTRPHNASRASTESITIYDPAVVCIHHSECMKYDKANDGL